MDKIITRFPPSPTGYLHVGGARTALFNWLYARRNNGVFVLRIEDTDTQRSTQTSVDAIFEALEWLGIDWDAGPFFQSQRFDIYNEYIQKLIDRNHAYYCTCSREAIDGMRKKARALGQKPKYDGTCRDKGLSKTENAVVRFKAPLTGTTILKDQIKGNIIFNNTETDDFILKRSDGVPTYNLAVVIDDITMGVNTVLRGDDHVNNTPKQIQLYQALDHDLPVYGHVPMVLGNDRTRLSKRHGAMSVTAYRDMGFLPDAVLNYLVRLGWSCGDQEFFTRNELVEKFTIENIGRSASIFDAEKLLALNAEHIRAKSSKELAPRLLPFLAACDCQAIEGDYLEQVIDTLKMRSKTLIDMAQGALFYYQDTVSYEFKASNKFLKPALLDALILLTDALETAAPFNEAQLETAFKTVMEKAGLKLGKIAQPVRVALTGKTISPGIFEIIKVLGKEKTIARLRQAIGFIQEKKATP
jgi:glutamyl-tRNA synthetase